MTVSRLVVTMIMMSRPRMSVMSMSWVTRVTLIEKEGRGVEVEISEVQGE